MRTKFLSIIGMLILLVSAIGLAAPTIIAEAKVDWDKSSLSIDGDCVANVATFTVTNDGSGDMAGTTTYSYSIEGDGSGSGTVPALASGESFTFSISAPAGAKVTVTVYQRPGHPGTGEAKADATCEGTPPVSHNVTYGQILTCDGWAAWYSIDNGAETTYASGGWTNGSATVPAFNIPTNPGETYNITSIGSIDLTQPEGCNPPPPTKHTVTYGQNTDCDGWSAWYSIDGGSETQYASGGWSSGAATVPSFNVPTIPGDEYNLTVIPAVDLTQPEGCTPPPPTTHVVDYGQDPTCDSWSAWYSIDGGSETQYASGGWTNGSATVPSFNIPTNPGEEYNLTVIPAINLTQPGDCTPPPPPSEHSHKLKVDANCTGYVVSPQSSDGVFEPSDKSAPLTGLWVDPEKDEVVTITGVWTWPDGFTATESVTIHEGAACAGTIRKNWKPTCPTCDLKNSKVIVTWPTDQGDAGWKNRKLEGPMPAGVSVSVVIDDCTTKRAGRCTLTQYVIVQYNATALAGKKIQFVDHGKDWLADVKPHAGADGNQWVLYVGRVCNWLDERAKTDRERNLQMQKCNSSNDWLVYIDGVLQRPYIYGAPNNLLYPYWLCSLPPSFAMTQQVNGKWQMEWLPGMNTWGASIWYLKYTDKWPIGWPEDTKQHSWIWKLPPLSDARKWADNLRLAGQFKFYDMPTK